MAKPRFSPSSPSPSPSASAAAGISNGKLSRRSSRRKRSSTVSMPSRKRKPRPPSQTIFCVRPADDEQQKEKESSFHSPASCASLSRTIPEQAEPLPGLNPSGSPRITSICKKSSTNKFPFRSSASDYLERNLRKRVSYTETMKPVSEASPGVGICYAEGKHFAQGKPDFCSLTSLQKSRAKNSSQSPLAKCLGRTLRKRTICMKMQPISASSHHRSHSNELTTGNLISGGINKKKIRDDRSVSEQRISQKQTFHAEPEPSSHEGTQRTSVSINKKVKIVGSHSKCEDSQDDELPLGNIEDTKEKKGMMAQCFQRTLRKRAFTKEVKSVAVSELSHQGTKLIEETVEDLTFAGIKNKVRFCSPDSKYEKNKKVRCEELSHENFEDLKDGNGWTAEQVLALQNAYFEVLPSSNFWFEVSKKVTGKTAKECFDRYYSSYPTPPATQSHGRRCASGLTLRTISFTKSPTRVETGSTSRFGRGKQGFLKAHQTVRNILRKQKVADGNYEADVFSTVEKEDDNDEEEETLPSLHYCRDLVVPSSLQSNYGGVDKDRSIVSQIQSPEVLKRETNPRRLDRYLDMLHLRRAEKKNFNKNKHTIRLGELTQSEGEDYKNRERLDEDEKEEEEEEDKNRFRSVGAARDAIITGALEALERVSKEKEKDKASMEDDESEAEDEATDMSDSDLY